MSIMWLFDMAVTCRFASFCFKGLTGRRNETRCLGGETNLSAIHAFRSRRITSKRSGWRQKQVGLVSLRIRTRLLVPDLLPGAI